MWSWAHITSENISCWTPIHLICQLQYKRGFVHRSSLTPCKVKHGLDVMRGTNISYRLQVTFCTNAKMLYIPRRPLLIKIVESTYFQRYITYCIGGNDHLQWLILYPCIINFTHGIFHISLLQRLPPTLHSSAPFHWQLSGEIWEQGFI